MSMHKAQAPYLYLQLKGTDICLDFTCCKLQHYDGMYQYFVSCDVCGKQYRVPEIMYPREAQSGEATDTGHVNHQKFGYGGAMLEGRFDAEHL